MSKVLIFFLLSTAFQTLTQMERSHANQNCVDLFTVRSSTSSDLSSQIDETDALITYIGTLLEHRVISEIELTRFINALERGEIINPISEEQAFTSSAALVHREKIQEFIDNIQLDPRKLLNFSKERRDGRLEVEIKREEVQKETESPYQKIKFFSVLSGHFYMKGRKQRKKVRLDQNIEVMATPVTQIHWVDVMRENPSYFVNGEHSVVINIGGKSVTMQPDHPVEMVTWWSTLVFANRLSELHGLKPAYDLSRITWKQGTKAEDGTLAAERGSIKINSKNRDYYQTEGYRLPTEAEQKFLLQNFKISRESNLAGEHSKDLKEYAWYNINSRSSTHPVGQLDPITINGNKFYDLLGNVFEWAWDRHADEVKGDTNPVGPRTGLARVFTGGSWNSEPLSIHPDQRECGEPNAQFSVTGFRLVRTLPKDSDLSSTSQGRTK